MIASLLLASCVALLARDEVTDPVHGAKIDAIVAAAMARQPIPGVAVAVLEQGRLTHAKGYGFADLEHDVPMRSDSICRIASITKQFTAAAILCLVEQGRVKLDDPLSKHVAGFGEIGDQATVRQLLNHTSGITDFTSIGKAWNDVEQLDLAPDRVMDLVRKQPKAFAPGTQWAYNNGGYFLLGMVIEKVAGKSYADYLEHDLLAETGLADTRYGDDQRILKRRAQGYRLVDGVLMNDPLKSMTHPFAAGAIVSTVVDLVRWSEMLAAGSVVSDESYAEMTAPGVLASGAPTGYGFGLFVGEIDDQKAIWHGGGIHGFSSHLAHYVDADVHVAVLANGDFARVKDVGREVAQAVLGVARAEVKDLPLCQEESDACSGKYAGVGMTALVRADGKTLTITPQGQATMRLKSQGERRFVADVPVEVTLEFDRAATPAAHFILRQGGRKAKFERVK
jgi:CubicO group peptidase (beta-lactamase class C family)